MTNGLIQAETIVQELHLLVLEEMSRTVLAVYSGFSLLSSINDAWLLDTYDPLLR